jgi:DNA polymerase V
MEDDIFQDFEMIGQTGFQSATNEYGEERLSLDKHLFLKSPSTYIFEAEGELGSKHFQIKKGDIVIIDRKLEVKPGRLVVIVIGPDFHIGKFVHFEGQMYLMPQRILLKNDDDVEKKVWGVIRAIVNLYA